MAPPSELVLCRTRSSRERFCRPVSGCGSRARGDVSALRYRGPGWLPAVPAPLCPMSQGSPCHRTGRTSNSSTCVETEGCEVRRGAAGQLRAHTLCFAHHHGRAAGGGRARLGAGKFESRCGACALCREAPRGSGWASLTLTPAPQLLMDEGVRVGQARGSSRPIHYGPISASLSPPCSERHEPRAGINLCLGAGKWRGRSRA